MKPGVQAALGQEFYVLAPHGLARFVAAREETNTW
jgi:hypothetical protein